MSQHAAGRTDQAPPEPSAHTPDDSIPHSRFDDLFGGPPATPPEPSRPQAKVIPMPTDPAERARLLARRRERWLKSVFDDMTEGRGAFDRGYRAALDVVYRTPRYATRADILRALNEQAPWEKRHRQRWGGDGGAA